MTKKTYTLEEKLMYWQNKIAYADKRIRAIETQLRAQNWNERVTAEIKSLKISKKTKKGA